MTVINISPFVPDLKVPRAFPCSSLVAPERECGATPASLYLRVCGVLGHESRVWLCPIHAAMASCGGAICRECAKRGGMNSVVLFLLSEPLRF